MTRATLTRRGDDFILAWPDWEIVARVEGVYDTREGLYCELTVLAPGGHLLTRKINLMATRSLAELAKELSRRGPAPWTMILEELAVIVVREWRKPPECLDLAAMPARGDAPLFLDDAGLAPTGEVSLLYGPGESLKSLWAMTYAMALQHDVPMAGIRRAIPTGVVPLFLDWEDTPEVAAMRHRAVAAGLGLPEAQPFPYVRMDRPLAEAVRWLRAEISDHGTTLIIVDSYVPASGDEPEGNEAATRFHRAVRSLGTGVTTLVVTHIAKADIEKRVGSPFGGVMVGNLCRSIWQVVRGEDLDAEGADQRAIGLGLFQRKNSFGRPRKASMVVTFHGRDGQAPRMIDFRQATLDHDQILLNIEGTAALLEAVLRHERRPLTVRELAERCGLKEASIKTALHRGKQFTVVSEGGGRGHEATWGLLEPGREAP